MKPGILRLFFLTIAILFLLLLPLYLKNNYHTNLLNQVLINSVIVMGLNFITGLTGQMNLGTAGIFSMGAYTSSLMTTRLGVNPWVGFLFALIMGLLIGISLGYPSLRVRGVYLSLTTIGFSEIVRILITNLTGLTGGALGISNIPSFYIFNFHFDTNRRVYYLYLALTAILVLTAYRVVNSKWGRAFKSVRDNPDAVEAMGLNISALKVMAFTFASVYGCIAGSMYAHYIAFINPSAYNVEFSINYVVMLIIGGIGSVPGNIVGAALVTLVPEFLRFMENYYWLVFGVITLLFVIFLPNGIASLFWKKRRKKGANHGDSLEA
jgi:branched-chain amino acid transport system permease protein